MKYKDMKISDLKELVLSCHDSIHKMGCYGTKDLLNLDGGIAELERRGYQVETDRSLIINKA